MAVLKYKDKDGNWKPLPLMAQDGSSDVKPGQVTTEGGEIFNDYKNNKALSQNAASFGTKTITGSKAFIIQSLDLTTLTYTLDDVSGLSNTIGAFYSCQMTNNYDYAGEIVSVDATNNTVKVSAIPSGYTLELDSTFWLPEHPELGTINIGVAAFATGIENKAIQTASFSSGYNNMAAGKYSFTSGRDNVASYGSSVGGKNNKALGMFSSAHGNGNQALGINSAAIGESNIASGMDSLALGQNTSASGARSISAGFKTTAAGIDSYAGGNETIARGRGSSAKGYVTTAVGDYSVAQGGGCVTEGKYSFSSGFGLKALHEAQTVVGLYNKITDIQDAVFVAGTGQSNSDRKNGFVVRRDGSAEVLSQGQTDMSVVQLQYLKEMLSSKMTKFGEVLEATVESSNGATSEKGVAVNLTNYDFAEINANKLKINGLEEPTDSKQAANKQYIDKNVNTLNSKINSLSSTALKRTVTSELPPSLEAADFNTIYMIGETGGDYDEYMLVEHGEDYVSESALLDHITFVSDPYGDEILENNFVGKQFDVYEGYVSRFNEDTQTYSFEGHCFSDPNLPNVYLILDTIKGFSNDKIDCFLGSYHNSGFGGETVTPYFAPSYISVYIDEAGYAAIEGSVILYKMDLIGSTKVDLTGYATEQYVDNLVGDINEALETALNGGA